MLIIVIHGGIFIGKHLNKLPTMWIGAAMTTEQIRHHFYMTIPTPNQTVSPISSYFVIGFPGIGNIFHQTKWHELLPMGFQ